MQQEVSQLSAPSSVVTTPSFKLWSPGFIAAATFFLGFPAGIVLASINWLKMKMTDKAIIHLVIGAVLTIIFMVAMVMIPGNAGSLLALAFNLGVLFYLRWQMEKDMNVFQAASRVEIPGWPGGCLIGLGVLLLFFVFTFFVGFVLVLLGAPIPN